LSSGIGIGGWRLMHRQPRQREAGDVDLLDRTARVLEPIEWRFRDQLESRRTELFEQRAQRDALARGQLFEVGERKCRDGCPIGGGRHFPDARDRGGAARCGAGNPKLSRGGGVRHRRADLGAEIGDAHERGPRAVALPAKIVGDHAEVDDVVSCGEGRQLCFGHEWSTVSV
jgi:hypothetical protein